MELQGAIARRQAADVPEVLQELGEPPDEFQSNAELSEMLDKARSLGEGLQQDLQAQGVSGFTNRSKEIFSELHDQVKKFLDQEKSSESQGASQSWKQWVSDRMRSGVGWAHRWTKNIQAWKPSITKTASGDFLVAPRSCSTLKYDV